MEKKKKTQTYEFNLGGPTFLGLEKVNAHMPKLSFFVLSFSRGK